jgi:hypothetical protein
MITDQVNKNGCYLFADNYEQIIERLKADLDLKECLIYFTESYSKDNPNFIKKLICHCRLKGVDERKQYYKTQNNNESRTTLELFPDLKDMENFYKEYRKFQAWQSNNGPAPYTELMVEIFQLSEEIKNEGPDTTKETEEQSRENLTTKEKLLLLDLLAKNKEIHPISGRKILEAAIPLILDISESTIEKNLRLFPKWFDPEKCTQTQKKDRRESILRLINLLEGSGANDVITNILNDLKGIYTKFNTNKRVAP